MSEIMLQSSHPLTYMMAIVMAIGQRHTFKCSGQILLHQYSVIWCKHW